MFNSIFEDYGEMANFDAPTLIFEDIAEDADRNGQRATELYEAGLITIIEARSLIGLETTQEVKDELAPVTLTQGTNGKIDPNKEEKQNDMKTFHPATPGSPAGSQKNNKKIQKLDPNVPSVR
jgi:hypothetical protein